MARLMLAIALVCKARAQAPKPAMLFGSIRQSSYVRRLQERRMRPGVDWHGLFISRESWRVW
jgi:hypothetical protein